HPLAEAVSNWFKEKKTQTISIEKFESITGKGVKFFYKGKPYFIGSPKFIEENNIEQSINLVKVAQEWKSGAQTVIYFADQEKLLAIIGIADTIKEGSAQAIKELQEKGIEVYMLTGDNGQTAKAISEKIGIKNFKAEVLPSDKSDFIKELQRQGKIVAMVGDGINDSQALAQADVGIAMAKGTDIAMDVAKMTLMNSDLRHIKGALNLSKATIRTIKQNLFWAFIYNVIGIPVAAGILFPFTGFLLNPMVAGAAMALSSFSVVANSLRLKMVKF
ncbi:MAG: HAD-IC family P-type ATPase, partial [Cytophagaceae bacterium]|nr:HAD-IC family P-type ATPase [Cytophagaceae bacterium]